MKAKKSNVHVSSVKLQNDSHSFVDQDDEMGSDDKALDYEVKAIVMQTNENF